MEMGKWALIKGEKIEDLRHLDLHLACATDRGRVEAAESRKETFKKVAFQQE